MWHGKQHNVKFCVMESSNQLVINTMGNLEAVNSKVQVHEVPLL